MKNTWLPLILAASLMLGACGPKETTPSGQAPEGKKAPAGGGKEVNVYMYSEYIAPELLDKFKKETGITVRLSPYETTEDMLAKMQQAGGTSQYDVVVVSDHAIPVMTKLKLLQPLDQTKIPNMKNVNQMFASPVYDPGNTFSLPYQWGTMGIIYRKDKVPNLEASWAVFFDPAKQPGPFVLIDSLRDMFAAALLSGGKSLNSKDPAEIKHAGEVILAAKKSPKCLGFEGGVGGKNKVAAGQAVMAIAYNGDAVRAMNEDKNIGFLIPKEGTEVWVDAMTIPSQAPNPEAAHKFINFILDPQNGAALSNFNQYATPNTESFKFIKPEDGQNPAIYPPLEEVKKMKYLEDLGEATRMYDEVWTTVKSR